MLRAQLVGAKSVNTAALRGKLPEWVRQPPSLAVPYGAFEQALAHPPNADVAAEIRGLLSRVDEDKHGPPSMDALAAVRGLVPRLAPPDDFREQFEDACRDAGVASPGALVVFQCLVPSEKNQHKPKPKTKLVAAGSVRGRGRAPRQPTGAPLRPTSLLNPHP